MELRQLRYFVRIVELGSMSRAAADLDMVQSALSQQITRLEGELATALADIDAVQAEAARISQALHLPVPQSLSDAAALTAGLRPVTEKGPTFRVTISALIAALSTGWQTSP